MTFPLETERLLLRTKELEDVTALHTVLGDPEVGRWLSGPRTLDEVRAHVEIQMRLQHWAGYSLWAIVERETGLVVGDTGLQPLDAGPEVEIGWRLRADRWGLGYATEAAYAALTFGFEEAKLDEIVAVTLPENARSRRVMEKLGMEYDGLLWCLGRQQVRYAIRRVPSRPGAARGSAGSYPSEARNG